MGQRIIKQRRKQIQDYVNDSSNNRFFPNAIITNIDTDIHNINKSNPKFPNKYKSIYVIDGQHNYTVLLTLKKK